MFTSVDRPWAIDLWDEISRNVDFKNQPVYSWAITDEQYRKLEDFRVEIVCNGYNSCWNVNYISSVYARLFLAWISEHYRRNGSIVQSIATDYQHLCGFTQQNHWSCWIERAEKATGRTAVTVGNLTRYVARVQQEAGLLRKFFAEYASGGLRPDGTSCVYLTGMLELWDRIDFPEHQLLQWKTGKDWYSRSPGQRPGGESFYSQFYECSLDFLRNLSQILSQQPSLQTNLEALSIALEPWVEPSDGLKNFLKDICGDSGTGNQRSKGLRWEPKADRCLYLQGASGNFCTRLRSPSQLPTSLLPTLKDLGGDRLNLKAFGEASEYDLGQYFPASGNAYRIVSEEYLTPLDAVRVVLQGKNAALESMLLDPLSEDQPWVFVQEESDGVECWKLVDDVQGRFPILVSVLPSALGDSAAETERFDLVQPGLQNRVCLRFETLDEFYASGIATVRGVSRALQLVPSPCRQPLQIFWNGNSVPVSMGLPRLASGARGIVERADSVQGPYVEAPPQVASLQCGFYRVRTGENVGPAKRLVVLPSNFSFSSKEVAPSTVAIEFLGLPDGVVLTPIADLEENVWRNVQYGTFLEYTCNEHLRLRIPAPVSGIAWKRLSGLDMREGRASLNMEHELYLSLDVMRNPATVTLIVSLMDIGFQEVCSIPLEYDFFAPFETGSRTQGRIHLSSLGDGVVRKLFAMTNNQDAKVRIVGMVSGAGLPEEKVPELVVYRFDLAPDDNVELDRFWVLPLNPMPIAEEQPSQEHTGVCFSVPCVSAGRKKVWDRMHRASGVVLGSETPWLEGTLHHILLTAKPKEFTNKILARLEQDLDEYEWELIENSFRLIREHDVPLVSLWLPQVVLRHDKTLCALFARNISQYLLKWVIQSSQGRFGTFGFDLRLVRTAVINQTALKCREALWSEIHLLHTGMRLEEAMDHVGPLQIMSRKWPANPESVHDSTSLVLRWDRLYLSGDPATMDLDEKAFFHWKAQNVEAEKDWEQRRCRRLNMLVFKAGNADFNFAAEKWAAWHGYANAWNQNPNTLVPEWIKAVKWLAWFTVYAEEDVYEKWQPFALKVLKMLEATDPLWFKAAFPIAQAQAFNVT